MAITPSKYLKGKQKSTTFNFKQSLENRIGADTYNTDIEQFNKDYGSDYLSNWHSADEINTYYDRLADLNDRTKAYQTYINTYGTDEQKSSLDNIGKQVSAYDEIIGARQDVLDYYGSFANADAYAKGIEYAQQQEAAYKAEQERIASLNVDFVKTSIANIDTSIANYEQKYRSAIAKPATTPQKQQERASLMNSYQAMLDDLKATKSSLEADITARELYDRNKKYTDILGSEEFASFVPTEDKSYDAVEKGNNPEAAISTVGHTTSGVGLSTADMALFQSYGSARYGEMTDEEYKLYKYLQETYGQEVAAQYAYDLDNELISRYQDRFRTYAEEHPILGTIASFVTSPLQGVDFISGALEKAITGNVRQGELTATTSAMREGAKQTITNGNKVGGFLYDTGTSMLDSILAMSLGGSAGGAILGASAASSAQNDVLARGGTAEQALASGLASGFFEGFFESFSIGALSKMKPKEIVENFKVFATNALKNVATNASEELATEVANIVFDSAYMGELSNAAIMFDQYMRQGLTEAEAKNKVAHELGVQALGAAASGALMGFGFSAIGGGVGLAKTDSAQRQLGKNQIKEGNVESLLTDAKELFKDAKYKDEQALIKKVEANLGKKGPSQQRNVGKLTGRVISTKFRELNKQVAEQSLENVAVTRKNVESEAKKLKVNSSSAEINYDNMPQILGFEGANLDKTMVETEQGAVKLTDMEISNAEIGDLYAYAVRLGNTESANAFIQNWDQTTDPLYYWLDWTKLQTRGLYAPEKMEKAMSDYSDVKLSPAAKLAAFKSGMSLRTSAREKMEADSAKLKETYKELGGKAKKGKFDDSKLNYSALTKEQKDVVNFTKILSDYLGVNITYFKSEKGKRGANGYYRAKNNTIYLDIYAGIGNKESYSAIKDCLVNTVSHEIVHNMAVNAPAEYGALRDFVIERLSEEEGFDLDSRVEQIMLENSDQGFTAEDAIEEIVAMSCEDLLGSSERLQEAMTKFYAKNEKAANSFTKFVREVLARLKAFFETIINKKSGTAESMLMAKQSADFISELQKRYDAALLAVREGNAARGAQTAEEKVKEQARKIKDFFIEDKYFARQIDNWNELKSGGYITVGQIVENSPLNLVGAPVGTLYFDNDKIQAAMEAHDDHLTTADMKKVPQLLNHPIVITEYKPNQGTNTMSVYGNFTTESGTPIVVGIVITKGVNKNVITKIRTVHARGDFENQITDKSVLFLGKDKKETKAWFRLLGIEVPLEGKTFGFIRSLPQTEQNVNPSDEKTFKQTRRDTEYLDAVNRGDMETAQRMVDEAAHKNGYTVKAYHGTGRADRVGNVFRPDRATSGPMAFFTDNKDIADNYARNKADTSIAYDTEYDSYYTQFRVNRNGKNISIPELWNYLGFAERNRIKEKAKHIKFDDDYENIIVDTTEEHGNGAWDAYTLNMHKGNALEALVDTWLETGDLFNRESDFIRVLDLVGISDVEYRNPDARYEKTYDTWLKIQDPFDTDNVNQSFYDSLSEWIDNHDMSIYEKETSNADLWDKNNQTPESWLKKLSHDIEEGTTHAWTVIPDFVTDYLKQQGYDGIKDKGGKNGGTGHTVWIPFSSEQIKSADTITYDDDGNVIPLSERFNETKPDIRYQKRIETPGASEVLSELFRDNPNLNGYADQRKELKSYQELLRSVKVNEQRIAEIDAEIKSLKSQRAQGGKGTRMAQLYEMRKTSENRVTEKKNRMFKMEATSLRDVVTKETARLLQERTEEERSLSRQKQKDIRENYARREYIKKIEQRAKGLTNAVKNVGDKHVPAPLREAIGNLVLSLDFSSKSKLAGKGETKKDIKFSEAFIELAKIIEHRTPNTANGESSALEEFFVDCDITDEFRQQFTEIKDKVDKIARQYGSEKEALVLRTLSSEQLRQINSALYKLAEQIGKANKLMANNLFKNVTEMSDEFIEYAEKFVQKQDVKWLEKLIDVENLLPYYAFKRMGEVGLSIFNEWADGMDKYAKVAKEVVDFTQDLYTAKEIKDWNNTVHEIEVKSKKLYFTTAHLMSFYCLWKREAAKSHISGYGIRVETFDVDKTTKKPLGKTYTNPTNGVHITDEAAQLLLDELNKDKRAKEVADALQKFMSTRCAELANEITMKRFGEKAYTEEFYFPMEVNENEKPEAGEINAESLYALVNKSFTKQLTPHSTSSLTIRNIFDVFAAHTTDVAAYHSLAMPLLDTLKFYNYKQKGYDAEGDADAITVRGQIEHAFGKPFLTYLKNFIKDTTGTSITSDRGSDAVGKWVSRYKIAAVAANLRVIVLQPTSYLRVSAVMKHRYLLKEIKDIPQLNKAVERMNKYSGVALWKNELGFRDVNISRSLADKIKHADTIGDKVTDIALKGAELADKITWANIWLACEEEIKATDKSVSVGSEAFYNKVSKRFREVIYSTQVVDSPLAKSNMARSKSFWNRTVTSFMSEPVVSHNLLLDSYHELADTKRRGEKITWGNVCRVGRLVLAYAINATAQSVVESLIDALRATADDDDEEFVEAYTSEFISNFLRELDPLSKIPIFKDVIDVIRATFSGGYYSGQDMQTAVFDRVAKAIKETMKYYSGESSTTKFIKRVLDALSSLTGIPIGNTYREIKTIWNNTMEMFNDGSGRIE